MREYILTKCRGLNTDWRLQPASSSTSKARTTINSAQLSSNLHHNPPFRPTVNIVTSYISTVKPPWHGWSQNPDKESVIISRIHHDLGSVVFHKETHPRLHASELPMVKATPKNIIQSKGSDAMRFSQLSCMQFPSEMYKHCSQLRTNRVLPISARAA
jgi:hypothetical protein